MREYRGSKVIGSRTTTLPATGDWQQVSVSSPPAAGGTGISVDALVSLPTNLRAHVDDICLRLL